VKYRIVRDTREQQGWTFPANQFCAGTIEGTLKTGDYTLEGLEDLLVVERKGSTAEVAQNVFQDRFLRELDRLDAFRLAFIVCEFTLEDVQAFPERSGIPRGRWRALRVRAPLLLKKITELQVAHPGVSWVFAGTAAKSYTSGLLKRMYEFCSSGKA
jgi:hypothetical protein